MGKNKTSAKASASKKTPKFELPVEVVADNTSVQDKPREITVIPPENHIYVCIETISNIKSKLLSQESGIRFRIQFGNDFVVNSELIVFSDSAERETSVKWQANIPCSPSQTDNLELLTANPVLLSVAEEVVKRVEDQGQRTESTWDLPVETPKALEFNAFAYCSLDLLPLIVGESEIRQTLLLEVDRKVKSKSGKDSGKDKKSKGSKKGKEPKTGSTSSKGKSSDKDSKSKSSKSSGSSKDKPSSKGDKKDKKGKGKGKAVECSGEAYAVAVKYVPPPIAELPLINVFVTAEKPIVRTREILGESNLIFITVESIYNLPANFDAESMEFQAGSLIPNEFNRDQVVNFGQGFLKTESDKVRIKRWIDIDHFPGTSSHTQYRMSDNLFPVTNRPGIDLCKIMNSDAPRIEWNKLRRSWLSSSNAEYLGEYLSKHKTWLLEILITSKDKKKKPNPKSKVEPVVSESMHLAAFFDVSKLTHPGIHTVRVVSQLFTYCKEDVEAKCGPKSQPVLSPPIESAGAGVKGKEKGAKKQPKGNKKGSKDSGKTSSKNSNEDSKKNSKKDSMKGSTPSKNKDVPVEVVVEPVVVAVPCEPKPWLTEEGKPVFILIELELMKPIKADKSSEELFAEMYDLLPVRPKISDEEMAAKKAGEAHAQCIRQITKELAKQYHRFVRHRKKMNLPANMGDQNTKDFYQFLKENNIILSLKQKLTSSLAILIKDKLGYDMSSDEHDAKLKHKFVSELYVRLFEEVNTIVNTFQDTNADQVGDIDIPSEQLVWFEQEWHVLDCPKEQKHFFEARIKKDDVLTRIEFACQRHDLQTVVENLQEIFMVDRDSREGLLLYAILLTKNKETTKAQLLFQAVCEKYPLFRAAGFFFYLFYMQIGNKIAAEVVWEKSRKITAFNEVRCDYKRLGFHPQPLDWDPTAFEIKSIYMDYVITLLHFRYMALDFAYLALDEELKRNGPSVAYYYFLSVCHLRAKRYEDACKILHSLLVETPRQNPIRRLLAHCQFEMGKVEAAITNYQFVVETTPDAEIANHLVHLRLGDFYIKSNDYETAKSIFLESCRCSPTANSWLGVGIACYMLKDFKDSELALTEANYLDRTLGIVWGYLALVNLRLVREVQFEQCYCRAIRYHCHDEKVLRMIEELTFACGFVAPTLIHSENVHVDCHNKLNVDPPK